MIDPTPKQTAFLLVDHREVLYGGAAGGGKSVGLLAAASQYLDVPSYSALLLRQSYKDLALPGALMDIAFQWWSKTGAKWRAKDYTWTFPSGATLTFGYLEREADKYQYQGSAFQFIGFDELTQFETESRYQYLFSRLRRLEGFPVPIRMRATTNPGGIGHTWVLNRFIRFPTKSRLFIPAGLDDNPFLDKEAYEESLSELDPVTREQLRSGNWDIDPRGGMFRRSHMNFIDEAPRSGIKASVRYWDLAASTEQEFNDPDWTVGTKMVYTDTGRYVICDQVRFRDTPKGNEDRIAETAHRDTSDTFIVMAQDPGQAGKSQIDHYRRNVLAGFNFYGDKEYRKSGKEIRAKPLSADMENGLVDIVTGSWRDAFIDELIIFPDGTHDDQVDSAVGAHAVINKMLRKDTDNRDRRSHQSYGRKKRQKARRP